MSVAFDTRRRHFLTTLARLTGAGLALSAVQLAGASPLPQVDVWKSPTCGCCNDWIKHLEASGFTVKATNVPDSRHVRARFGMPAKYASCHTALVGGYVVEGHVPAREIKRLLREKPAARGLSVPGMPVGSPGMEMGDRRDPYNVVAFTKDGRRSVFAQYR